jgi:hypothetical protein
MTDFDLFGDTLAMLESDFELDDDTLAFFEDDEARRPTPRRAPTKRRPVPAGKGSGYYKPRVKNTNVTQQQLTAALAKISKDVKANAAGVKTVGARVDSVVAEQKTQAAALKKEIADRRKESDKLKQNLQMASLLPLLTSKSITTTEATEVGGAAIPAGTKLSVQQGGAGALLPLLLLGGDGLGGGDSSNTLLLVLALSGGL